MTWRYEVDSPPEDVRVLISGLSLTWGCQIGLFPLLNFLKHPTAQEHLATT